LRIENGKQEEGNYELSREGIIKDSNKKIRSKPFSTSSLDGLRNGSNY